MGERRRYDVRAVLTALGMEFQEGAHDHLEARCPFHDDSKPSWFIHADDDRQGWNLCRACGGGGGLVGLVMHVRGYLGVSSALGFLEPFEVKGGGPLPERVRVARYVAPTFRVPGEVVWDPLERWPSAARAYAQKRGVTAKQVDRWGVGYAVDGWLAGYLVFGLRDHQGALRGYHARIFIGEGPRYRYPRGEDGADPGAVFGEQHWPPPRERKHHSVTVWEGAIKALAFERAMPGELFAAIGGSRAAPEHAAKLSAFGDVTIATDDDDAGEGAASMLASQLQRHVKVRRVRLPKDPDEMTPDQVRESFR